MPKPPKAKASEPKKPSGKMNWRNYAALAVMLVLVVQPIYLEFLQQ